MRRTARSPRAASEIIVAIGFAIGGDRLRRRLNRRPIVVADALVALLPLGNLAMPRLVAGGKRIGRRRRSRRVSLMLVLRLAGGLVDRAGTTGRLGSGAGHRVAVIILIRISATARA